MCAYLKIGKKYLPKVEPLPEDINSTRILR